MTQFLTVVINGRVVRVTLGEWEALYAHGATDAIVLAIQSRLNRERIT